MNPTTDIPVKQIQKNMKTTHASNLKYMSSANYINLKKKRKTTYQMCPCITNMLIVLKLLM
jgi:hypothetical protein